MHTSLVTPGWRPPRRAGPSGVGQRRANKRRHRWGNSSRRGMWEGRSGGAKNGRTRIRAGVGIVLVTRYSAALFWAIEKRANLLFTRTRRIRTPLTFTDWCECRSGYCSQSFFPLFRRGSKLFYPSFAHDPVNLFVPCFFLGFEFGSGLFISDTRMETIMGRQHLPCRGQHVKRSRVGGVMICT